MPLKPLLLAACSFSALVCLTAGPIHADSSSTKFTKPDYNGIEEAKPEDTFERPEYKSVGAAYAWSILGTAAPLLLASQLSGSSQGGSEGLAGSLMLGGLLVGPSLGQFYAGSPTGGFLGFGIRSAGGFVTVLGFVQLLGDVFCLETEEKSCNDGDGGGPLLIAGALIYVGGTLYSLIDAGRAVERHNNRQSRSRAFGWSPTIAPGAQGDLRTGALAWMRF